MKVLLIAAMLLAATQIWADTKLFLFGGGTRPTEGLRAFTEFAGSEKSSILVIPWASIDNEGAENIRNDLIKFPVGKVEIASTNIDKLSRQILQATGIFFAGGEQDKIMKKISELNLKPLLKDLFAHGVIFAGTSAGTAIMSERMITGEGNFDVLDASQVELAEGLGLLPENVIVDQHFIIRSRYNRLTSLVLKYQTTGVAVDEGNVLFVHDDKVGYVWGPTHVLFFSSLGPKSYRADVFDNNEQIDLSIYTGF
jgi:cyanophycinase